MTRLKRALIMHIVGIVLVGGGIAGLLHGWTVGGSAAMVAALLALTAGAGLVTLGLRNAIVTIVTIAVYGEGPGTGGLWQTLREEFYLAREARDGAQDAVSRRAIFERYFQFNPHLDGAFASPDQAARRAALLRTARGPLALEVGCATGGIAAHLSENGIRCVGLDISFGQVCHALGPGPYLQADAYRLPFRDGSFDTVLIPETLEHLHDPGTALAEAARVSRGRVVVSVPVESKSGQDYSLDPTHVRVYDERTLRNLIEGVPELRLEHIEAVTSFLVAVCCRVPSPD